MFPRRQSSGGGGYSSGGPWEKLWDAALDEGPRCIQWMKRLVKALCHRCFGDRRDCAHEHVDISQELINCLANTDLIL